MAVPCLSMLASAWRLTVRICCTNQARQRLRTCFVLRGDVLKHTSQLLAGALHVMTLGLADGESRIHTGQTTYGCT